MALWTDEKGAVFDDHNGEALALPGWSSGLTPMDPATAQEFVAKAEHDVAAAVRLEQIDARLAAIDAEALRPLRAVVTGAATQFDTDKLAALESEAAALRLERSGIHAQKEGDHA
jgi:hypothetical protein